MFHDWDEIKVKLLRERNDLRNKIEKLYNFLCTEQFGTLTLRHKQLLYT